MLRRLAGIAICLGPVALAVASLAAPARTAPLGAVIALGAGLLVGAVNFYIAFFVVTPGKSVSGFPAIGTAAVVAALWFGFGSRVVAVLSLLSFAIDIGGLPWFLFANWRDRSFWDGKG